MVAVIGTEAVFVPVKLIVLVPDAASPMVGLLLVHE